MANLRLSSRLVLDTSRYVDLASILAAASTGLLGISPSVPVNDFSQFLVGKSALQVAELTRGPSNQLSLVQSSRYSDVVGGKWIPEAGSSHI
jgi:hypothetical protein